MLVSPPPPDSNIASTFYRHLYYKAMIDDLLITLEGADIPLATSYVMMHPMGRVLDTEARFPAIHAWITPRFVMFHERGTECFMTWASDLVLLKKITGEPQ